MATTTQPIQSGKNLRLDHVQHFINGVYVDSANGETMENVNPATGTVCGKIALGGKAEIDAAVAAAKAAYPAWKKTSMKERCAILIKIGDGILARLEEFAQAETRDTGKPITESRTGDIPRSALNFHFFGGYSQSQGGDCFVPDANETHVVLKEPLGVVGLITPWNLPLYLASWKIAPALAMGNTVVLKPAEWTPTTTALLGEVCNAAGLPPGVLNVVHGLGPNSAGEALTTHPDVKAISFTGETTTGKAIMKATADTLKKVSFELGGKGANIIFDDADLEKALPTAIHAAFRNQGQICLAGSRLYVQRSIYPQVIERLKTLVDQIQLGDPTQDKTTMGPVISEEHLNKVLGYMQLAQREGTVLCGGKKAENFSNGYYLEPTLVSDVSPNSRLVTEEIFGPLLPVIPFDTEEETIEMANSTRYGLSASVWSRDINRCHRMSQAIECGMVWVNCWFARDLRTPFGGMKESGLGREGGRYALEFFSETKTIATQFQ